MKVNQVTLILSFYLLSACQDPKPLPIIIPPEQQCLAYYNAYKDNGLPSESKGNAGNGSLLNGKLLPYKGKNFQYFDPKSYLSGRAFVHQNLKKTLIQSYSILDSIAPGRSFYIMECSAEKGGKLPPHNTHRNGLSVDLMMPKLKNNKPFYDLDTLGFAHYTLAFDDSGRYGKDSGIVIDFELLAHHILVLEKAANKNDLHIIKVIIKTELKDELFAGKYGQQLKKSDLYITRSLTPIINNSHDEHIHVDFALKSQVSFFRLKSSLCKK
jgi:penicillin-insensitive murein endopeptidase